MIHPHTRVEYIGSEKGHGLVATKKIPRGSIIWVHDPLDRVISQEEMENIDPRFSEILLTYCFRNNRGDYVFCWDNGRFINHSFHPNCCLTAYGLEVAVRDILPDEELTDDYGYLNIIEPFDALPEGGNRTTVYPDDLLRYSDIWDDRVRSVLPLLTTVDQPLQEYLDVGLWQQLLRVVDGSEMMRSIRTCYYDPDRQVIQCDKDEQIVKGGKTGPRKTIPNNPAIPG